MNLAVIGSGGREHALCYTLKKSSEVEKLFCIPGNAGTKKLAENISEDLSNFEGIYKIIKEKNAKILINGPIEKRFFLKKKYPGMTEYFAAKAKKTNEEIMLIYNKNLAVSPVTTHLPLKLVAKQINKKNIQIKIKLIHEFYKDNLNIKPRIGK